MVNSKLAKIEICIGVFNSEFYAFAYTYRKFKWLPVRGDHLYLNNAHYSVVDGCDFLPGGSVVVRLEDYCIHGDDEDYGRGVSMAVRNFIGYGWTVEVPESVTLPVP